MPAGKFNANCIAKLFSQLRLYKIIALQMLQRELANSQANMYLMKTTQCLIPFSYCLSLCLKKAQQTRCNCCKHSAARLLFSGIIFIHRLSTAKLPFTACPKLTLHLNFQPFHSFHTPAQTCQYLDYTTICNNIQQEAKRHLSRS